MWPATAWDDRDWDGVTARGWTVMGALQRHRDRHVVEARAARRRLDDRAGRLEMMSAASIARAAADEAAARWTSGPNVLALLFAHPDSEAMAALDARGEYFDHRTGDTWDLFFPGYYRSPRDRHFERESGARPMERGYLDDWYFHPGDFDLFRQDIERLSGGRWRYSGSTDLVLASGWMTMRGEPSVDWTTTVSGSLTDDLTGVMSLSLPEVIERLSSEIEQALASPDYGVPEITGSRPGTTSDDGAGSAARDVITNALGGIIAALGLKALGG